VSLRQRETIITAVENTKTFKEYTYKHNRTKCKPKFIAAWRIQYFDKEPLNSVLDSWRHFPETDIIWTWHASFPLNVSCIAARGFLKMKKLGKLFGDGIYQSTICEVCCYYAKNYYGMSSQAILVLSRTKIGRHQQVTTYKTNEAMNEDTYFVLHTDGKKLGTPRRDRGFFRKGVSWLLNTGHVTGEEIIVKFPGQVLPQYLVHVCY